MWIGGTDTECFIRQKQLILDTIFCYIVVQKLAVLQLLGTDSDHPVTRTGLVVDEPKSPEKEKVVRLSGIENVLVLKTIWKTLCILFFLPPQAELFVSVATNRRRGNPTNNSKGEKRNIE
ncbi:unnamed protein product [Toxocara canis]|uniref:Uncharacterized protein n=1 Tax=Toxocara canis TaxID=6265 RepID=A0A183U0H5_TOXCA|nr:unnamed protein product [Toxocara canis]